MRFISRDPIGIDDGLHMYAYVGNDPINYTDPSGECALAGAAIGGGIELGLQLFNRKDRAAWGKAWDSLSSGDFRGAYQASHSQIGQVAEGAFWGGTTCGVGGAAASSIARTSGKSEKFDDVFRVVDDIELADIQKVGKFQTAPGGFESGKQFLDNLDDALGLQAKFSKFFGGNQTVVTGAVPRSVLDRAPRTPLSDIPNGQAITIPVGDLPKIIPKI